MISGFNVLSIFLTKISVLGTKKTKTKTNKQKEMDVHQELLLPQLRKVLLSCSNLPDTSQLFTDLPFQFILYNLFFILAPLRKILLISLAYNYLTISANCSWSWGAFSGCDFCHSLDCFGKRHFSYVESKSVSFSTLFFVTNSYMTTFKFTTFYGSRVQSQAEEKNTAELWKYIVFSEFSASFCVFAITANL